jgi:UDPglucose 6-dehydrogenase
LWNLNEERIAAWNDEDVDNIQFTNRVCRKSLNKPEEEPVFSTDVEKAIDEAQIIFISVNTPTKTYGKRKRNGSRFEIYRIMRQTNC